MNLDYIKHDEEGHPFNGEFPPKYRPWEKHDGYEKPAEAAFFYDYAVQGYNIDFKYMGESYALLGYADGYPLALLDAEEKELQRFDNPMDAVRNCTIQGHKLLDILDDITDIECG